MVQRVVLLLASLSSAAILFVALFGQGDPTPGSVAAPSASAAIQIPDVALVVPTPEVTTQVDNVYIQPAATPKTIRIAQTNPPPASTVRPTIVQRVRPPATKPDAERTGGGDDD